MSVCLSVCLTLAVCVSVSAVCLEGVLHLGYVVVVLMGWDGGRGSQRGMETAADERTCGKQRG